MGFRSTRCGLCRSWLRTVSSSINPWGSPDDTSPDQISSHMLDHLPPLQELSMLDYVGPRTLQSILGRHSTSLRKLELVPKENPQMAMALRGTFPTGHYCTSTALINDSPASERHSTLPRSTGCLHFKFIDKDLELHT